MVDQPSMQDSTGGEGSSFGAAGKGKAIEELDRFDNNASDYEDLVAWVTKIKQEKQAKKRRLSSIPAARQDNEQVQDYGPNPVRVYIGNPHTIFIFQRSNLDQSPVLSRLVSFDSASGYYVMSPLLSLIDPADFEEVAQYLEYQEYFPEIYDADTDFVSLDGLDSQEDKIETTDRCMIVTLVAQKLEMPELQALAVSKFKALQPFRGDQFLVLTQLLLGSSLEWEGPMYDFVVEYFSGHFRELQRAHRNLVDELLNEHQNLAINLRVSISPDIQIIPNPAAPPPSQDATSEHGARKTKTSKCSGLQGAGQKQYGETTTSHETTRHETAGDETQEQQTKNKA